MLFGFGFSFIPVPRNGDKKNNKKTKLLVHFFFLKLVGDEKESVPEKET